MEKSFTKLTLYSIVVIFIVILYLISMFSFKDGMPTCDNYVFNVYLYLAMSVTIVGLATYGINQYLSKPGEEHQLMPLSYVYNQLGSTILVGILLTFVFVIMIAFTENFSKTGHLYNHIIWLLFILSISIMIYPYFKAEEIANIVDDALLSTAIVFIFMSIIVYTNPEFFQESYNFVMPGLIVGLLAIIIVAVFNLFFTKDLEQKKSVSRYISYGVIVLFSLFISFDTSKMFTLAKQCVNYPNYPKSSVDFFLDLLNLFVSFINIYGN